MIQVIKNLKTRHDNAKKYKERVRVVNRLAFGGQDRSS